MSFLKSLSGEGRGIRCLVFPVNERALPPGILGTSSGLEGINLLFMLKAAPPDLRK